MDPKSNDTKGLPKVSGKKQPTDIADMAALMKECDALKAEVAKLTDMAARSQADLQNAKDRMRKEAVDMRSVALESVLLKLLPTINHLQLAFQHLPEDLKNQEWVKGIAAIEQDFMKTLGELGFQKMESLGQPLDPNFHEVLQTGEGESGKVIEVYEEGYMLNGRVLKPAKVKVGMQKET